MKIALRLAVVSIAAALPFAAAAQDKKAAAPAADKKAVCRVNDGAVKVKITTSMGPIVLQLDAKNAPVSTDNFVKYVESGFYNGTIFHRVIDGFMIQGGGFTKDMGQKTTNAPIKNEGANGLKNDNYTIAMARTQNPDSATSQFFINVKDNDMLNAVPPRPGYAVFGKVVEGKETVDKIKLVPTGNSGMHQNVPTTPVTMDKVECL